MEESDILDIVEKLKSKLNAATSKNKEEKVLKVIQKLSLLPMTIEILKESQIGKLVNSLRKWNGDVSVKSKLLVKKWKMLLETVPEQTSSQLEPPVETSVRPVELDVQPVEMSEQRQRKHAKKHHHRHRHHLLEPMEAEERIAPVILVDSDEGEVRPVDRKQRTLKRRHEECIEVDDFSKALTVPVPSKKLRSCTNAGRSGTGITMSSVSGHSSTGGREEASRSSRRSDVLTSSSRDSLTTRPSTDFWPVHVERSPILPPPPPPRETTKHKVEQEQVLIAQSKRSRTQVYSGKKTLSGPQVVTSLFDMCMKILIDNIELIEEVGPGVPYHVLEPLLLKCTAVQLMKLEEFNPHLMEDTDKLWEKLVLKDFKEAKLPHGYDWREFYSEKLAEREEKLKNLTSRIKANNRAREEPVRKVKLAEVSIRPGRRSGARQPFMGRSSRGGFRPLEKPHPGSGLLKKTMKMAKERNHMMTFKLGK